MMHSATSIAESRIQGLGCSHVDFNLLPVAYFSIQIQIHLSRWDSFTTASELKSLCERSLSFYRWPLIFMTTLSSFTASWRHFVHR